MPELPAEVREQMEMVFEHLNANHADTVLLLGTHLAGRADAIEAELVDIDTGGVLVATQAPGGEWDRVRMPFGEPLETLETIQAEAFAMIAKARERAGESVPLTSLELELAATSGLPTYVTEVVRTEALTPRLRQITFGGGLDDYQSLGGDQFLLVLVPPDGQRELGIGPDFTVQDRGDLECAYYTVRKWRPEAGELDTWFVLHGDAGPLSAWAARAQPGDPAGLWGPRRSFVPPDDAGEYVLVGDETAFPAISAILDELRPDDRAAVVVETIDPAHVVALPDGPNIATTWVFRGADAPGTGTRILDALAANPPPASAYVFGAGESRQMTAIRKHLRNELGLPADQVLMTGYWRRANAV